MNKSQRIGWKKCIWSTVWNKRHKKLWNHFFCLRSNSLSPAATTMKAPLNRPGSQQRHLFIFMLNLTKLFPWSKQEEKVLQILQSRNYRLIYDNKMARGSHSNFNWIMSYMSYCNFVGLTMSFFMTLCCLYLLGIAGCVLKNGYKKLFIQSLLRTHNEAVGKSKFSALE